MKPSKVGQAGLFSLALAPMVGASINFGDSEWTVVIGLGVILFAAAIFIAAQSARARRSFPAIERRAERWSGRDKVSSNLVALSSAAVLAIYAAGYLRTSSAAQHFAEQSASNSPAAPITQSLAPASPAPSGSPALTPAAPAISPPTSRRAPGAKPTAKPDAREGASVRNAPTPPPRTSTAMPAPAAAPNQSEAPSPPPDSSAPAPPPAGSGIATAAPIPSIAAQPAAPPAPVAAKYKDGSYKGWGFCRHGDIEATVVIHRGQIVSAEISQCLTRYPCSVIKHAPDQVVSRQNATVDFVSGATQSAFAYHDAVSQALAKAQ